MSRFPLAQRLPLLAIIKGLREAGEIGELSLAAIAGELRAACSVSDGMGHRDTSESLKHLADCVESGRVE